MKRETLSINDCRRTAAAALLILCAANSGSFLRLPGDSVQASEEANVWQNINDTLNQTNLTPVSGLTMEADHSFSFTKGHGELAESCVGYYQPKTRTYTYIGAIICR